MFPIKDLDELRTFFKNEIMTTTQVREYLGVTRAAVNKAVAAKKLNPLPIETANISLFLRQEVEEYKQNRRKKK
jgi:predicted DNA-binding transcriptional regulator AlpA